MVSNTVWSPLITFSAVWTSPDKDCPDDSRWKHHPELLPHDSFFISCWNRFGTIQIERVIYLRGCEAFNTGASLCPDILCPDIVKNLWNDQNAPKLHQNHFSGFIFEIYEPNTSMDGRKSDLRRDSGKIAHSGLVSGLSGLRLHSVQTKKTRFFFEEY